MLFFYPQVVEIPGVKSKVTNWLVEWLHVRVVRGSQKALAIENGVVSLQDHAEPLEEEHHHSAVKFYDPIPWWKRSQKRSADRGTQMLTADYVTAS